MEINTVAIFQACSLYIGLIMSTCGFFGNIISIFVWSTRVQSKATKNKSTVIFLIALSFTNGMLLLIFLLYDTIPMLEPRLKKDWIYLNLYVWCLHPSFYAGVVTSVWLVAGITLNRFIMVALPTKAASILSVRRSCAVICGIVAFASTVCLPQFFTFEVRETSNQTFYVDATGFGRSKIARDYDFWVHCLVLVLVPWFTVAGLNISIIYCIRKQWKFRKSFQSGKGQGKQRRQEHQLTKMLIAIITTFLILLLWQCLTQCFWMQDFGRGGHGDTWEMVESAFSLAKLGVVLHASTNWIFYCSTCSVFRKELRKMFGFLGRGNRPRSSLESLSPTTNSL